MNFWGASGMDYAFYTDEYHGSGIPEDEFSAFAARAEEKLAQYKRVWQVSGTQRDEALALCAMADALSYFDRAANGGIAQSVSVGSVSTSFAAPQELTPAAREAELLRCARTYLSIYKGVG